MEDFTDQIDADFPFLLYFTGNKTINERRAIADGAPRRVRVFSTSVFPVSASYPLSCPWVTI